MEYIYIAELKRAEVWRWKCPWYGHRLTRVEDTQREGKGAFGY